MSDREYYEVPVSELNSMYGRKRRGCFFYGCLTIFILKRRIGQHVFQVPCCNCRGSCLHGATFTEKSHDAKLDAYALVTAADVTKVIGRLPDNASAADRNPTSVLKSIISEKRRSLLLSAVIGHAWTPENSKYHKVGGVGGEDGQGYEKETGDNNL